MAASLKAKIHVRSNSLPSRIHPQILGFEEQLHRLRASPECQKLGGLKDLCENVDDLLQLPLIQQALSREQQSERVEHILDGSLCLVDVCGTTKDVFSQMKETMQELESSLRRRRDGESGLANEVNAYMISKKKLSKMIGKLSDNLKKIQKKSTSNKESDDQVAMVTTLREVEEISLDVFESLLSTSSKVKIKA